jgi:hypothetical protein
MIEALPNYFLADLPPGDSLTPSIVTEACRTLKRNRARYLQERTTASIVRTIASISSNWLDAEYPFRQQALAEGPTATGFSAQTLAHGLDTLFSSLTADRLNSLLVQDLGHADRLDRPAQNGCDREFSRAAIVTGPELLTHITGGVLPNPVITGITFGLLTRSAQFVKCATGTSFLPRLFAHSLYASEPKLASCLEIAEWRGGDALLEDALFAESDCVCAMGSDQTIASLRPRVRGKFLGHGHRVSFGYLTRESVSGFNLSKLVQRAAADVAAWDQLGCLSPHVFYVETGGAVTPEQFAAKLAAELATLEQTRPRGPVLTETAAAITTRRSFYEVRASASADTRLWASAGSTAWTVVFEADPAFAPSCLHRFIHVKAAPSLADALRAADRVHGRVSTVALAAAEDRAQNMVRDLARWGVIRVCAVGDMQNPPITWRHDGRPSLGDLVTWTDWENGG